ncbi:MAG: type II secretion system protein [Candidatus Omnitrophota bacterium]|nr:type II secretion system GspH family protein [Candidatus Omnitrophota bacterium]
MGVRKNNFFKGFTLVELLIAVVILISAIGGALLSLTHCILLNETNSNLAVAANDAQFVLEQVKELAYGNISSYTPPVFTNLNNENVTVQRTYDSGLVEVTVNVEWEQRQRTMWFNLSTRIAD